MPLDPLQATMAPEPVTIAGRTFPVRQLSVAEWAALHGWLRASTPNPVRVAAEAVAEAKALGRPFSPDLVGELYSHAQAEARAWPPPIGSFAWLRAVNDLPEGPARFVLAVLAAGGTATDLAACEAITRDATADEMNELLRVAYWGGPPTPKAPEGTTTTTS